MKKFSYKANSDTSSLTNYQKCKYLYQQLFLSVHKCLEWYGRKNTPKRRIVSGTKQENKQKQEIRIREPSPTVEKTVKTKYRHDA